MLIFGGLFIFWLFFSRTPHKAYTESNGTLIPINTQGQFQYPQQNMNYQQPYPGNYPGGGGMSAYHPPGIQQQYGQQSYGQPQPHSPYVAPNYYPESTPVSQGNKYGSQYPQSQYLQANNDYSTAFSSQPYQSYQPQPEPTQRSRYTVDHPQSFQPYPDSHYAPKTMQSNYRSDFKA